MSPVLSTSRSTDRAKHSGSAIFGLPAGLWAAIAALGVLVSLQVVPGVFIVDDCNYLVNVLALREGRLTIANTEGLTPSPELLFFDPGPQLRIVEATPVASTAPPLYAPLALPFSLLEWRGLVVLNTLAYLATILMVFLFVQRRSIEASTPWVAAFAFALGGYVIEYAQGVWPHALSIALCTGGVLAAAQLLGGGRVINATVSGFLLALAAGVRYQNAVILIAACGGILLWASHRRRAVPAFVLAAALPLAASSFINHARLDSWNPISKGKGYLNIPLSEDSSGFDPFTMLWSRLVDYSARPPLVGPDVEWDEYDAQTGAHVMVGLTTKKALLQSAPWAVLGFLILALAWVPWWKMPPERRLHGRLLSLPACAVLGVFALAGVQRHDGLAFNERYLMELLPFAAIGLGWALDGLGLRVRFLVIGGMVGAGLVLAILLGTPITGGPDVPMWTIRQLALMKVPLVLALILGGLWILRNSAYSAPVLVSGMVGVCLGWGMMLHLADDLVASRWIRSLKLARTEALRPVLTDQTALLAYKGYKDPAVPLLFDRDVVILDVRADQGADAPGLIRELLARGRRVFLLREGFPADVLSRVLSGLHVIRVDQSRLQLLELRLPAGTTPR